MAMLGVFCANFAFVFLKAFQQRNVAFDNFVWVMPTSMLMAAAEVFVVVSVVQRGFSVWPVLAVGMGAGLGAISAMWIHRRYLK